jgi:hypothetical protein
VTPEEIKDIVAGVLEQSLDDCLTVDQLAELIATAIDWETSTRRRTP